MNEFELTTELIQIRSLLLNFIISNEVFTIEFFKSTRNNEFAIGVSMSCGHFDKILLYFVF